MAISVKHRSPFGESWGRTQADLHNARAIAIINHRIGSSEPLAKKLTDGVLGAVFTLAFAERVARHEDTWKIHVGGLSQMIMLRRDHGERALPSWFQNLLVFDSVKEVFLPTRARRKTVLHALGEDSVRKVRHISTICEGLAELRRDVNACYAYPTVSPSDELANRIQHRLQILHHKTSMLRSDPSPYLQAFSRAIEIFLHLTWPCHETVDLPWLAVDLKRALCVPLVRLCSSMDLTYCQFMIGAVAAEDGSETKAWYLERLASMLLAMQLRGWDGTLEVLERGLMPDAKLLSRFKALWMEIVSMHMPLDSVSHKPVAPGVSGAHWRHLTW